MKKVLIIIQFILTFACLVLGIMCLFSDNKLLIDSLEIIAGVDLIIMGINNYIVYKKTKVTIIYTIVGLIMILIVVLTKLGVI